jgi:ferritin-like metal-binding protein YciE
MSTLSLQQKTYYCKLGDQFCSEGLLSETLQRMSYISGLPEISEVLNECSIQMSMHKLRLFDILYRHGQSIALTTPILVGAQGFADDAEAVISHLMPQDEREANLLMVARQIGQYESESYTRLTQLARQCHDAQAANLLGKTLAEVQLNDQKVGQLQLRIAGYSRDNAFAEYIPIKPRHFRYSQTENQLAKQ